MNSSRWKVVGLMQDAHLIRLARVDTPGVQTYRTYGEYVQFTRSTPQHGDVIDVDADGRILGLSLEDVCAAPVD